MFKEILATVLVVLLIAAPLCAVAVMFWRCLLQFFALTPEDELYRMNHELSLKDIENRFPKKWEPCDCCDCRRERDMNKFPSMF